MDFSFNTICFGGLLFFFAFLVYALANGSNSLRRYILTRLLLTLPMIFILLTTIFLVMRLLPGDPVSARLKPGSSPELIAKLRADLNLDKPIYEQYVLYLGDVLRGDFGRSAYNDQEVGDMIAERMPATLELVIPPVILMLIIGVYSGAYAAHRHKSAADYSLRIGSVIVYSFPIFWVGLMLQLLFGVYLGWLPTSKRIDPTLEIERHTNLLLVDTLIEGDLAAFQNVLSHMILPTLTLTLALMGVFVRLTRVNMIETLGEDYVTAAHARGVPERRVVYRHALRNSLIPVMTLIGLQVAILMAGAILTETTFSWPGMGLLIREGIAQRDYPTVQGAITIFAIAVAFISLVTDILYAFVDPRIRY
jgi:peptide/nickel transport system permease protein